MSESIMQTDKSCYITGASPGGRYALHRHHIFAGANRRNAEKYGCWCWLRADYHNMANYGVHSNRKLDLILKRECQMAFEKKYSHEMFMQVFGKNYL